MKKCDCCKKTEDEQGTIFDCEVWNYKGKDLLLCDDCFFNEKYLGVKILFLKKIFFEINLFIALYEVTTPECV